MEFVVSLFELDIVRYRRWVIPCMCSSHKVKPLYGGYARLKVVLLTCVLAWFADEVRYWR